MVDALLMIMEVWLMRKKIVISACIVIFIILLIKPAILLVFLIKTNYLNNLQINFHVYEDNEITGEYIDAIINGVIENEYLPFKEINKKQDVEKLIEYMLKNNLRIVSGSYWIGEHYTFEQLQKTFKFIPK